MDDNNVKLVLRCVFADDSTETVTINDINPSVGVNPNIRAIIRTFNDVRGGELSNKMKSKNGFNWIGIDKATVTQTAREYIF